MQSLRIISVQSQAQESWRILHQAATSWRAAGSSKFPDMSHWAQDDTVNSVLYYSNTDTDTVSHQHSSSRYYRFEGQQADHKAIIPVRKSKIEKKASTQVDIPTLSTLVNRKGNAKVIPGSVQKEKKNVLFNQPSWAPLSSCVCQRKWSRKYIIKVCACLIMDVEKHISSQSMLWPIMRNLQLMRLRRPNRL